MYTCSRVAHTISEIVMHVVAEVNIKQAVNSDIEDIVVVFPFRILLKQSGF